ncbi:hypothetical protein Pcinc_014194 [Petrolisthes cinctipes]|uniref:Bromo domain-containing protein n=1 Tax=Petrolisthes cinctipes TaxID=88211 RepID=A0AAE1KS09_PETCI|nr:hypothetical protein Pcinc_014194 [Petrolisthes cinctipes]
MEKTPLKLKLKLGSGSPSTPEQKKTSPIHPTIITNNTMEDEQAVAGSEEEVEEEECAEEIQGEEEQTQEDEGKSRSRHSHHDDGAREKHKKSKKKKKKKEREKDKERHKHRHHRDKAEGEDVGGDEPVSKKPHLDTTGTTSTPRPPTAPDTTTTTTTTPTATTTITTTTTTVPVLGRTKENTAALTQLLEHLLGLLEKKDPQQFFAWPVTDAIAPGYSTIISNPMDFSTMKHKITDGLYNNLKQFQNDFELMCKNCMTYNQQDTVYYKAAKRLLHLGQKSMVSDKLMLLKREVPLMTTLTRDQLGFEMTLPVAGSGGGGGEGDDSMETEPLESMDEDTDSKEPQSKFEAVQDDMSSEEILEQVQTAASQAAEKLTQKKPAFTLGFLRQRGDGTTSLSFLTGCEGNDPTLKEKPVSLGLLTGKLTQGSATLHNYRDDKRNMAKPIKPLYYGSYSSFCPSYDSTFANLTKEESEMVYATYGNETAVQYAKSICDFSQDCDMAMHLVDQLLNLLTHQQHSRTTALIEDRRRLHEEEDRINTILCPSSDGGGAGGGSEQKTNPNIDFGSLRSLSDLGIDTGFINHFEDQDKREKQINSQLDENATLLVSLAMEQKERLSRPLPPVLNNMPQPTTQELKLVEKVTEGLTAIAKKATPGALAPVSTVRRALGITMQPVTTTEPSDQIEVDIEDTTTTTPTTSRVATTAGVPLPPRRRSSAAESNGSSDLLESQLRHILNQGEAASPPPVTTPAPDMTDGKLKEILGN